MTVASHLPSICQFQYVRPDKKETDWKFEPKHSKTQYYTKVCIPGGGD